MVAISVVMPTYNTPIPLLKEAIDSILNQTFSNFEFIIIDDGSTDDSPAFLDSLSDSRIKVIRNEKNIGITKSLNIGFREAQGKYIARMDSDDISVPERFEKQYAFMESNPDVFVCGSRTRNLGEEAIFPTPAMEDMESYRVRMLFSNPGPAHPTAFFNRELLNQYSIGYDEELRYAQDYGIWMSISRVGRIWILPEALVIRRTHESQITVAHREKQRQCDQMTQRKLLEQLLGAVSQEEVEFHYHYSTLYYRDATISPAVCRWYRRLIKANRKNKIYDQLKLKKYVYYLERRLIYRSYDTKKESGIRKLLMQLRYLPLSEICKSGIQSSRKNTAKN